MFNLLVFIYDEVCKLHLIFILDGKRVSLSEALLKEVLDKLTSSYCLKCVKCGFFKQFEPAHVYYFIQQFL